MCGVCKSCLWVCGCVYVFVCVVCVSHVCACVGVCEACTEESIKVLSNGLQDN